MNARLPLIAGVLALLALGVFAAAPGAAAAPTAAAGSGCGLHVTVSVPSSVRIGQSFQVVAKATSTGSCPLYVAHYMFFGLPAFPNGYVSTNGIVLTAALHPGPFAITAVATTNLGNMGGVAVVVVH